MQLGVIFPQTEIGADPKAVRDFVQAAEEMGATTTSSSLTMSLARTPRIIRDGKERIPRIICFTKASEMLQPDASLVGEGKSLC